MRTLLWLLALGIGSVSAADFCGRCGKEHALPKPLFGKPGRKYARDHLVDIEHLKLDVTPDFTRRSVVVISELKMRPVGRALSELRLDAVNLNIREVKAAGATVTGHQNTGEHLVINFAQPVPVDQSFTLTVQSDVQPAHGLYFRTPQMGYKEGDTQLWTQGEAELHRHWFPCYDYPNERFTSEVLCHVPDGMDVISNGKLISKVASQTAGYTTFHWLQDKPHVNYLVALAAGYFHRLEAKAGELPLAMLVPPSEKDQAANAFRDTAKIVEFFQKEIGVPFAWDKYYQVYCHDFLAGGMENTSCTFEAASMLFTSQTEQLRTLHRLDAHETAHQWFGDLLTCRDWSHLWLNEGFASYYTVLYEGHRDGPDAERYALWHEAEEVLGQQDTKPIVWRDYGDPMDQFDYRAYPKGAWVLHMIRSRIGPELYRKCVRTYLDLHRNQVVGTDDLQDVLDDLTGLSWDRFFDQWLYHGGHPELNVTYNWDAANKSARITVKQTQKVSDVVRLFHLDLPVSFTVEGKPQRFTMPITEAEQDFSFPLDQAPQAVRLDPDYTQLAKIQFTPPPDLLKRQLTESDVIGRLLAVRIYADRKDAESTVQLQKVLTSDAFYGVRMEAARAVKKVGTSEARAALIASRQQVDARVRSEVVTALAAFPHREAQNALWEISLTEKNPAILAAIIKTWGSRPGEAPISAALRKHLDSSSYRDAIAIAAITALKAQDDATAAPFILSRLQRTPENFNTRDLGEAYNTLAFLSREEKDRSAIRSFLIEQLSHPKEQLRSAAAQALGTLGDPAAIAVLEPLTQVSKPYTDPLREAAAKSVQSLQAQLDQPSELKNVWQRLQDLQKKTESLEAELKKLKPTAAAKTSK